MPAQSKEKAIQELHYWQHGDHPTNFTSQLFTLFQKADSSNVQALKKGFPFEFEAWKEWSEHPSQDGFFKEHGLPC